jgi:hypothetical protein
LLTSAHHVFQIHQPENEIICFLCNQSLQ